MNDVVPFVELPQNETNKHLKPSGNLLKGLIAVALLAGSNPQDDRQFLQSIPTNAWPLNCAVWQNSRVPRFEVVQDNVIDVVTEINMLTIVKETFGLNLSDLAMLVGVSRPTIYAYLRTSSYPQKDVLGKIRLLYENALLAQGVFSSYVKNLPHLLRRSLFEGSTLFDLLLRGDSIETPLQILFSLTEKEEMQKNDIESMFRNLQVLTNTASISPLLYKE